MKHIFMKGPQGSHLWIMGFTNTLCGEEHRLKAEGVVFDLVDTDHYCPECVKVFFHLEEEDYADGEEEEEEES